MAPLSKVFRGRSNSSTPPRAVYNDLNSAYSNITGRGQTPQSNWPLLSPGWAEDQPAAEANPKSTPISEKARISSGDIAQSPLAGRRMRSSRPPPVGTPEIPDSEIGTRFPSISPRETRVDARVLWPERGDNSANSRRRSRSVGDLTNHAWYEAAHGSGHPISPAQHRFPSSPQTLGQPLLYTEADRAELPNFQFPNPDGMNPLYEIARIRGTPRGIPAHSTISDIVQSYSGNNRAIRAGPEHGSSNALSITNVDNPYRHQRQLSQTAWSPRPSNEGVLFTHQIGSTHGSIVDPEEENDNLRRESSLDVPNYHPSDEEPRDAVQDVIDQVFNPQAESSAQRGTHATAIAALVRPNGETITRGMSRDELMRYEQLVQSHVRNPSAPSIFDAGSYANEGRLSFEYQQSPPEDFDIDRSVNMSSSSTSFETWNRRQDETRAAARSQYPLQASARQRSGTPPLLFGNNALGLSRERPSVSIPGSNDEGDWETVGEVSRTDTRAVARTMANSSSLADYSSSSTGVRGLPPGGQTLQQPPHPRYVHTWNMFRDRGNGRTVIVPDTSSVNDGHDTSGRLINSPVAQRPSEYHYHHPSPLSGDHTNPFTSSPASDNRQSSSQYTGDASNSAAGSEDFLEMSPRVKNPIQKQGNSSGKDNSSAWVSTEEGPQDAGLTGARELGSSIANGSSPGVNFSSSPYVAESDYQHVPAPEPSKQIYRSRSVGSSLVSLSTLDSNDSYRPQRQRSTRQPVNTSEEYELTALPSSVYLSADARFHRQQLIDNNLLPRDPPAFSVRRSLGLGYLKDSPSKMKKATAATGANFGRHFQHFMPNMASSSHVRQRSPHRRDADINGVMSDIEMQGSELHHGRTQSRRIKDNTKSKLSDSEGSMDSEDGLTSSDRNRPNTRQPQVADPGTSTAIEPVEPENIQVHPTHTGIVHGQVNTTRNMVPGEQIQVVIENAPNPALYGNNTDYNLRRLLDQPSVEEMLAAVRDHRPTPRLGTMNRPVARAESPHLWRIPRAPTEDQLRHQKDMGRMVLYLCMLFPPVCLFYAAGYLDVLIEWSTNGDLTEMPAFEKKIAWFVGGISFAVLTVVAPILAVVASK